MQLTYFNRDRVAAQTVSHAASSNLTHTLIYRGASYELPKHHSIHPSRTAAGNSRLISKPLIYRGVQYEIASATAPATPISKTMQHLIYRGAAYTINAA